jgi:hypothetical protein
MNPGYQFQGYPCPGTKADWECQLGIVLNCADCDQCPCDEDCIWQIYFCSRTVGNEVQFSITAIYSFFGTDCDDCIGDWLLEMFLYIPRSDYPLGTTQTVRIFTPGRCYINYGTDECSVSSHCCERTADLTIGPKKVDGRIQITDVELYDWIIDPECPDIENCESYCFEIITDYCNYDCNYGEWTESGTKVLPVPDLCPNCTLEYKWEKRIINCHGEILFDYRIADLDEDEDGYPDFEISNACLQCSLDILDYYQRIIEDILYMTCDNIQDGESISNVRTISASCWKVVPIDISNSRVKACNIEECCKVEWEITKDLNGICTFDVIDAPISMECDDQDCSVLCYGMPYIISDVSDKYKDNLSLTYPNPSEGILNFQISDGYKGKIDIKILDSNGNYIVNEEKMKNTFEIILQYNISQYHSGTYFINVIMHNKKIEGCFKVIK